MNKQYGREALHYEAFNARCSICDSLLHSLTRPVLPRRILKFVSRYFFRTLRTTPEMEEALLGLGSFTMFGLYVMRRAKHVQEAVCVFHTAASPGIEGHVEMRAVDRMRTEFKCTLRGLSPGLHGFHVHTKGDLRDGCASACSHYNPTGATHGGPRGAHRHRGDLGNIEADASGGCETVVIADVGLHEIIGRMLIIHADPDDLGHGGDTESLKTGNAGKRIACGVIGLC